VRVTASQGFFASASVVDAGIDHVRRETSMADSISGGTLRLADDLTISRMGYGAMQLTGPRVFGPPKDRDQALAVLREAVNLGVTHIDTADFYGPVVVNELIREALHPYPADLRIVTKVGARRTEDGGIRPALEPGDLRIQVHENLEHLGVDTLDVVNLRLSAEGTGEESPAEQFGALAWLLQRSATSVVIPGTSSVAHLRENVAAASLILPAGAVAELDTIGR
jgi:pyridoxine 4-dehydrogenase